MVQHTKVLAVTVLLSLLAAVHVIIRNIKSLVMVQLIQIVLVAAKMALLTPQLVKLYTVTTSITNGHNQPVASAVSTRLTALPNIRSLTLRNVHACQDAPLLRQVVEQIKL